MQGGGASVCNYNSTNTYFKSTYFDKTRLQRNGNNLESYLLFTQYYIKIYKYHGYRQCLHITTPSRQNLGHGCVQISQISFLNLGPPPLPHQQPSFHFHELHFISLSVSAESSATITAIGSGLRGFSLLLLKSPRSATDCQTGLNYHISSAVILQNCLSWWKRFCSAGCFPLLCLQLTVLSFNCSSVFISSVHCGKIAFLISTLKA